MQEDAKQEMPDEAPSGTAQAMKNIICSEKFLDQMEEKKYDVLITDLEAKDKADQLWDEKIAMIIDELINNESDNLICDTSDSKASNNRGNMKEASKISAVHLRINFP